MRSLTPVANTESSTPRYADTNIETATTRTAYTTVCFFVGHVTCFISAAVSLIY